MRANTYLAAYSLCRGHNGEGEDVAVLTHPGVVGTVFLTLINLTESEIDQLRSQCTAVYPCRARWQIDHLEDSKADRSNFVSWPLPFYSGDLLRVT